MDGPILVIDRHDTAPIGAQLVDGLRRGILTGRLRAGDPMPSTRSLAAELGVARSSVVQAYEQLAGEGYLETRQGAPTRVAELERGIEPVTDAPAPRPLAVSRRAVGGGAAASRAVPLPDSPGFPGAPGAPAIDLTPGIPSMGRLDERAWRAAWRAAAASIVPAISPPPLGVRELREQVADHLRFARGVACSADDIVVTAGTSEALALIAVALGDGGDGGHGGRRPRVAVEDPGYPSARRTLRRHGADTTPVAVGPDGIDVDALARVSGGIDAVMVTPSHQYPLGGRLPVADRLGLLEQAAARDALVIEDDYDSEFRHTGAPLPALASLDRDGRVVLVGSFSKVLTPWLRLGYLVLPSGPAGRALRERITAIRDDEHSPVPGIAQLAMAHLLASGALRRHIAATRREYAHRRRLVLDVLGPLDDGAPLDDAGRGVRLTALDGGLHAVLQLPDAAIADAVVARLAGEGIVVAPLSAYVVEGGIGPSGIVIGYAGAADTALAAALTRIRAGVERLCREP
ncbi:aminotransferase class I/II-fold pyridoxal phosphate-dependent enzyme [Agromyces sp. CFH 90414]|uniref:Aminotransferase class I/II-fold pyridoxal phosphate-dependent enzyme n=1 Tax=Agromyces agglutinans TaxID=2662258 RepID=A0A6I2F5J5_9MICO|nr:PLP-dependent aminotransferase family protein [Agromyces agglutinans]MRG59869.1 aminotransferase class I/II-fold pyridoxal phosphate-dependent enzyme [Agromyces agglutinans]